MIKRTFTRDELDELDIPFSRNIVHTEQIDTTRWATHHICIFRTEEDGPLWQVGYQRPATEQQECDRWYDEKVIEATQVEPHEITVVEYRPVEQ